MDKKPQRPTSWPVTMNLTTHVQQVSLVASQLGSFSPFMSCHLSIVSYLKKGIQD